MGWFFANTRTGWSTVLCVGVDDGNLDLMKAVVLEMAKLGHTRSVPPFHYVGVDRLTSLSSVLLAPRDAHLRAPFSN